MKYSSCEILEITNADLCRKTLIDNEIEYIVYDTRKLFSSENTLFLAFEGKQSDGHEYISIAYEKGVRDFIITDKEKIPSTLEANFYLVDSTYAAIQKLASFHRSKFNPIMIAITGSNGKTIVKEWLYECLKKHYEVLKSPVSYNSQLGVALSLLMMEEKHEIAIIEAGISMPEEMINLASMIKPMIGIFTNLGDAHQAGFLSPQQKLEEKSILFDSCDKIIFNSEDPLVFDLFEQKFLGKELLSWSSEKTNIGSIVTFAKADTHTLIELSSDAVTRKYKVAFTDELSLENITQVILLLESIGLSSTDIQAAILQLSNVPMRLEIKKGVYNSTIINDSYSLDLESLKMALQQLDALGENKRKILVISDLDERHLSVDTYQRLNYLLANLNLNKLINIGGKLSENLHGTRLDYEVVSYKTSKEFMTHKPLEEFKDSVVLLKGARKFQLDKISNRLSDEQNRTVLEIDLSALRENILFFKEHIPQSTGLMAVLKASAYGSGSEQLTSLINQSPIDMVGVAITKEAIDFKMAGMNKPILIFNPHADDLIEVAKNNFRIELSNFSFLDKLIDFLNWSEQEIYVHLKLDTGMNRLGYKEEDLKSLLSKIKHPLLKVEAIFSHLLASDDLDQKEFSKGQLDLFDKMYHRVTEGLGFKPKRHILNSAGALTFPEYGMDYIRLGLGLYGLDLTGLSKGLLQRVHSLRSYIVQIKDVPANETIGYGNQWRTKKSHRIAVIGIGYADGLFRNLGHGQSFVEVKGQEVPFIGSICMDLSMIDISNAKGIVEGDEVLIFGKNRPIEDLATAAQTIPYEILTRIAPRVKRVYIQ